MFVRNDYNIYISKNHLTSLKIINVTFFYVSHQQRAEKPEVCTYILIVPRNPIKK